MNAIDNTVLAAILVNDGIKVFNPESDIIEYKSDFDWDNREKRAKYSKAIAAFCNSNGGYLIFGIDDKTKEILGVANFDKTDSAHVTDHLNNYFSPSIKFYKHSYTIAGKVVGIIYIEKYIDIPTICIKEFDKVLKDGALFYRYSGKSDYISGTDMIHILHLLKAANQDAVVHIEKERDRKAAKPNLFFEGAGGGGNSDMIRFHLNNDGERGIIKKIVCLEGDLIFTQEFPMKIEKERDHIFYLIARKPSGIDYQYTDYKFEIYCGDKWDENTYKFTVEGRGLSPKVIKDEIVK